jgi:excisionase family DNA binding protein
MNENPFNSMMAAFSQEMENRIYERLITRLGRQQETEENQKNTESDYLKIDELCELTKLKKSTIYAKRSRREIPAYIFGLELRFKRPEVELRFA